MSPTALPFRTVVQWTVLAAGLLIMLGYITFQARFLLIGPQISLTEVPDSRQNERQITLAGSAFNISRLWLNGRPIYTDAEGNFQEALVLENGYTVATLRAEDRYGRETIITRSFVYAPMSFRN